MSKSKSTTFGVGGRRRCALALNHEGWRQGVAAMGEGWGVSGSLGAAQDGRRTTTLVHRQAAPPAGHPHEPLEPESEQIDLAHDETSMKGSLGSPSGEFPP